MAEDFFSTLGKSISKYTQKAVESTGTFVESTKISTQISGEKREIDQEYKKIGEIIYRRISKGEFEADEELKKLAEGIDVHRDKMNTLKEQLADVKGQQICPNCGELIPKDVAFCPKCGAPVEIKEEEPEKKETDQEKEEAKPSESAMTPEEAAREDEEIARELKEAAKTDTASKTDAEAAASAEEKKD